MTPTSRRSSHAGLLAIGLAVLAWLAITSGLVGAAVMRLIVTDKMLHEAARATPSAVAPAAGGPLSAMGSPSPADAAPPGTPGTGAQAGPTALRAPRTTATLAIAAHSSGPDSSAGSSATDAISDTSGVATSVPLPPGVTSVPFPLEARLATPRASGLTRRVTATPEPPEPTPDGSATIEPTPSGVDWPTLPNLTERHPVTTTLHFRVFAADEEDALLVGLAKRWAPELEGLLAMTGERIGNGLPETPVNVGFARSYRARCPARGLAVTRDKPPVVMVFVDDATEEVQIRAVLAHELTHQLTGTPEFVGDGVLTEGIANWGADGLALAWQGFPSWDAAVRSYLDGGTYISVADPAAQSPAPGEACLARRDRVYNARTAFVDWLIRRYGLRTVLAMPYVEIQPEPSDAPSEDPSAASDAAGRGTAGTGTAVASAGTLAATDRAGKRSEPERDSTAVPVPAPPSPTPIPLRIPDYEAATGHSLQALEMLWLQDVRRQKP